MKKVLGIALTIALAAVFVNDVGRYAKARYDASVIAQTAAEAAASNGKTRTRNENAIAAANAAARDGGTVYLYDQDENQAYVWVRYPVNDTFVWGRFLAWQNDQPLDTVPVVELEDKAFLR